MRSGKKGTTFGGSWIKSYWGQRVVKVKVAGRHTTRNSVSQRRQLHIPPGNLQQFSRTKRYGNDQTARAAHKVKLTMLSDAEILLAYKAELRGLANFSALAHKVKTKMGKLQYLWRGSLFLTLAHQHKANMKQREKRRRREEGTFEVHHVRKLKDGAHGKEQWQQLMAARHRKTLIFCKLCHQKLHAGTLPEREDLQRNVKGEPDTWKLVSPVRREGDG